jgi:hypothetical protein
MAPITTSAMATHDATRTGVEISAGVTMITIWRNRFAAPNATP